MAARFAFRLSIVVDQPVEPCVLILGRRVCRQNRRCRYARQQQRQDQTGAAPKAGPTIAEAATLDTTVMVYPPAAIYTIIEWQFKSI
jgi:hypothetical protein